MDSESPRRTDAPARFVSLTGKVFPWNPSTQQPEFIQVHGSKDFYLPCFSKATDLRAMMTRLEITGYTIKLIQDGLEFRSSIPPTYGDVGLHVMLDPYYTAEGRIRFSQVLNDQASEALSY